MNGIEEKCVACGELTPGSFGPDEEEQRVPCCQACADSGEVVKWAERAIARLRDSRVGFVSHGNLAKDLAELEAWERHNSREEDGICPNGCARLERLEPGNDYVRKCPSCGFIGQSNAPFEFPFEEPKP